MACISPFTKDGMQLPCGKCYPCTQRKASQWSFRLLQEAEAATTAFFLTLTYDTDHVPITPKGFMTLENEPKYNKQTKRWYNTNTHIPLYLKRIRKRYWKMYAKEYIDKKTGLLTKKIDYSEGKIKYFAVGEYGTEKMRPHYHMIIFNAPLECLIPINWVDQIQQGNIELDGKCHMPALDWPHGTMTIGRLTPASAAYTMKYISKKGKIPLHQNDDRFPEFSLMSKGLGEKYLNPLQKRWHKTDKVNRLYVVTEDGKKISMPRYYKDKLYTQGEKLYINMQLKKKQLQDYQKLSTEKQFAKDKKDYETRIAFAHKKQDNTKNKL